MRTGARILWIAVTTTLERGLPLVTLFTFIGLAALLAAVAARASPALQLAIGIVGVLCWFGAAVIGINVLIDSSTEIELSSMYVTDYHGIAWTTANLIAGKLVADVLFLAASALFWIPFFTRDAVAIGVLRHPAALTLPQLYILLVQAAALLATVYAAIRLLLVPAFIAVESADMVAAFRRSISSTHGNAHRLLLPFTGAAVAAAALVVLGARSIPAASSLAVQHLPAPYGPAVVAGGTFLLLLSTAVVFVLAVIAAAYSTVS